MELTLGHLEILARLGRCRGSVKCTDLFVPDFSPASDLEELGFIYREVKTVREIPEEKDSFYILTTKGEKYLERILEFASEKI